MGRVQRASSPSGYQFQTFNLTGGSSSGTAVTKQLRTGTSKVPDQLPIIHCGHQCFTCLAQRRGTNRAALLDLNQGRPSIHRLRVPDDWPSFVLHDFLVHLDQFSPISRAENWYCTTVIARGISMLLPKSRTNNFPSKPRYIKKASRIKCHSASQVPASRQIVCFDSALLAQGPPDYWSDVSSLAPCISLT